MRTPRLLSGALTLGFVLSLGGVAVASPLPDLVQRIGVGNELSRNVAVRNAGALAVEDLETLEATERLQRNPLDGNRYTMGEQGRGEAMGQSQLSPAILGAQAAGAPTGKSFAAQIASPQSLSSVSAAMAAGMGAPQMNVLTGMGTHGTIAQMPMAQTGRMPGEVTMELSLNMPGAASLEERFTQLTASGMLPGLDAVHAMSSAEGLRAARESAMTAAPALGGAALAPSPEIAVGALGLGQQRPISLVAGPTNAADGVVRDGGGAGLGDILADNPALGRALQNPQYAACGAGMMEGGGQVDLNSSWAQPLQAAVSRAGTRDSALGTPNPEYDGSPSSMGGNPAAGQGAQRPIDVAMQPQRGY
jgi:hypothetical protein